MLGLFQCFAFGKLIEFMQSPNLMLIFFNFELYSFVIKIAIVVIRAELVAVREAIFGLMIDFVKDTIVELDLIKIK